MANSQGNIDLIDYISLASINSGSDATSALNTACTAARNSGNAIVIMPTGNIVVTGVVDFSGVTLQGQGKNGTKITASAGGYAFVGRNGNASQLRNLRISYTGTGGIVDLTDGINHTITDSALTSNGSGGGFLVNIGGSNVVVRDNFFTNQSASKYCILNELPASTTLAGNISINNHIKDNYFGGVGKGIAITSVRSGSRVEGLRIGGNKSVLTGGPLVECQQILSLMIHDNMIDQANTTGGIYLSPVGLGILGVTIRGNYISTAQDQANGIGIYHNNTGAAGMQSLSIVGNEFAFSGEGVRLTGATGNIVIDGNVFYTLGQNVAVRTYNGSQNGLVMGSNAYGGATPLQSF